MLYDYSVYTDYDTCYITSSTAPSNDLPPFFYWALCFYKQHNSTALCS